MPKLPYADILSLVMRYEYIRTLQQQKSINSLRIVNCREHKFQSCADYAVLQISFVERECITYCCKLSTFIINLITSSVRIIIFKRCMNRHFFRKLTQYLLKCNDQYRFTSLIFSKLYKNALQNVLTD